MRWRYPQENNKEGAAFVSNGTKHYAISVNKIIFLRTTAHHCSIGLWCQIPFEHWYRVQDRGRTWSRIQDQAAGWTLRCPRVPLGCNLDNLTRCWLLEFYQSPQHETQPPASTRDLKWTNGDPFHSDIMFRVLYFRLLHMVKVVSDFCSVFKCGYLKCSIVGSPVQETRQTFSWEIFVFYIAQSWRLETGRPRPKLPNIKTACCDLN